MFKSAKTANVCSSPDSVQLNILYLYLNNFISLPWYMVGLKYVYILQAVYPGLSLMPLADESEATVARPPEAHVKGMGRRSLSLVTMVTRVTQV